MKVPGKMHHLMKPIEMLPLMHLGPARDPNDALKISAQFVFAVVDTAQSDTRSHSKFAPCDPVPYRLLLNQITRRPIEFTASPIYIELAFG